MIILLLIDAKITQNTAGFVKESGINNENRIISILQKYRLITSILNLPDC